MFGGICFVSVLVLMFSMRETRGLSLEAIQEVFSMPDTAHRGRVVSMLRRWAGLGNSSVSVAVENTEGSGSGSAIEL
jgi:hypothetical protein